MKNFQKTLKQAITLSTAALFVSGFVFGLGLVTSIQDAKAANIVLNTQQISSLLANRTIKQVDDQYFAYYTRSGQVKALYVNALENGSWTVRNNQVCHKWQTWNKGKLACFYVIQGQQGAYRFQDTRTTGGFNFTLKSGNQQGL